MKASGIGGQAVLEGIMMKNKDKYSVAVRLPNKEITVDVKNCSSKAEKYKILKVPFIRGVYNFIDSLVLGIKTLTYSAEFFEDEEDEKQLEKEKTVDKVTNNVFKEKSESVLMGLTVFVSIIFSVALFILLPYGISELLKNGMHVRSNTILALVEGVLRIVIFVLYLLLISKMEDIQRTFMYHGAEHKCINCIEHGFELNVENVRMSSRIHKRCGTSFLFFVMFISIICFIIVSAVLPEDANVLAKVVARLLLVPVIAGISYEILRAAGKSENKLLNIISKPGMAMQKFTTKEPDDSMIEVGIKAVEAVFDWEVFLKENFEGSKSKKNEKDTSEKEKSKEEMINTILDEDFVDVLDAELDNESVDEEIEKELSGISNSELFDESLRIEFDDDDDI